MVKAGDPVSSTVQILEGDRIGWKTTTFVMLDPRGVGSCKSDVHPLKGTLCKSCIYPTNC
ncbi:hypothetical protein X798_02607 [Onchocerca flexuosa]|uniref:Uncharacterized protein n=1 Tax=Onchocerca flexuosa TaxID=387005 RepID=A0A238C008_9BILA|nr:hypothetical protein X798_02607 [Onchocerca flexuosa]